MLRRAEHVVPERRADAEAARVVLEVVAHVQLAQALPEARLRAVVMQVVMHHVVDQVAGQEARSEGVPVLAEGSGSQFDPQVTEVLIGYLFSTRMLSGDGAGAAA